MAGLYAPSPPATRPVKEALVASGLFDVEERDGVVKARRRRRVPDRGLLRMLVPRVVVRVRARGSAAARAIRPDALAWFMLVVIVGGVITEWTMDRARYPREYPPAFIYGLAALYGALFVVEVVRTRRAVMQALGR